MHFICLMGMSGSGKSTIEKALESYGYKRSVSYTTREPQVRNGKLEEDGNEYRFVTVDKFKALYNAKAIIEFEEYNNNFYGTPEPIGADKHVAVLCTKGYKALKEKYGNQVIGVYLKCEEELSISRIKHRHPDENTDEIIARLNKDKEIAKEMEEIADIVIDAQSEISDITYEIIKYARERERGQR